MRSQTSGTPKMPALENSQFAMLRTAQLREGATSLFPIFDARNVLLVGPGAPINGAVIERLLQRGITSVKVHHSELSRLSRQRQRGTAHGPIRSADQDGPEPERNIGPLQRTGNFQKSIVRHGTQPYSPEMSQKMALGYRQSLDNVQRLFESLDEFRGSEMDLLEGLSADALCDISQDIDLFVSMGIAPEPDKYPARHSQQTAMLAMSLGATLGVDRDDLVTLGMGCLAHDAGMLHIKQVFGTGEVVDRSNFLEITKHPSITMDLMRDNGKLAGASRLVAYQMHERCNGSGYPRGRTDQQIHPLSKMAAVADVFTALISPRPHRPGMMPYHAVEHVLRGARMGLFDQMSVRGLLRAVSLFPIGSCIELSDGRVARVLRANGDDFAKPTVQAWRREALDDGPQTIDLRQVPLIVKRPLPCLTALDEPTLEDMAMAGERTEAAQHGR